MYISTLFDMLHAVCDLTNKTVPCGVRAHIACTCTLWGDAGCLLNQCALHIPERPANVYTDFAYPSKLRVALIAACTLAVFRQEEPRDGQCMGQSAGRIMCLHLQSVLRAPR